MSSRKARTASRDLPVDEFEKLASEVLDQSQGKDGRRFSRTVFGGADLQNPDKTGRVLVKPDLRDYVGVELSNEIAVIGVFDHIELWRKDRWWPTRLPATRNTWRRRPESKHLGLAHCQPPGTNWKAPDSARF